MREERKKSEEGRACNLGRQARFQICGSAVGCGGGCRGWKKNEVAKCLKSGPHHVLVGEGRDTCEQCGETDTHSRRLEVVEKREGDICD